MGRSPAGHCLLLDPPLNTSKISDLYGSAKDPIMIQHQQSKVKSMIRMGRSPTYKWKLTPSLRSGASLMSQKSNGIRVYYRVCSRMADGDPMVHLADSIE